MDEVRIFISYAREDEAGVKQLYQHLADAGFQPWLDREHIVPGMKWEPVIKKALKQSDFVLVCLSGAFGQTYGGSYLAVFFVYKPENHTAIIISARDERERTENLWPQITGAVFHKQRPMSRSASFGTRTTLQTMTIQRCRMSR